MVTPINKLATIFLIMKNKFSYYCIYVILKIFLSLCFLTCRWKIHNPAILKNAQLLNQPILICCWHSRFLLVSYYFKIIKLNLWAISSTHRDSQMMAKILTKWGLKLIKGSSTRGWMSVLRKMLVLFEKPNSIIAVTNDGPKGPPLVAKEGSIKIAIKANAQIIAVTGEAERFWSLPSWDKTIIPKPFTTIHIQYSKKFDNNSNINNKIISKFINDNYNSLQSKL